MRYYKRIVKKYRPGEIIFSEDSDCDGMYIIDSGRVRVYKTMESNGEPKEIELCILTSKSMFGEMAMIDDSPRSASVQAIESTTCTLITKKIFEDQLAHIPNWMVTLIRILVQRLRETNDKLRGIVQQYTNVPDDDSGRTITVTKEKIQAMSRPTPLPSTEGQNPALKQQPGTQSTDINIAPLPKEIVEPEDIIKDLFK